MATTTTTTTTILSAPTNNTEQSGPSAEEAENQDCNDDNSESLPQPVAGNHPYTYLCADTDVDPLLNYDYVVGQLVWVLKSKGKRRTGNAEQPSSDSNRNSKLDSTLEQEPQLEKSSTNQQQQQVENSKNASILELFLRARVDAVLEGGERFRVRYPKGSTYCVARDHLLPILDDDDDGNLRSTASAGEGGRRWVVVVPETAEYRRLCVMHTLPDDEYFVEIGCDRGHCVQRVWQANHPDHSITKHSNNDETISTTTADVVISSKEENPRIFVGVDKAQDSIDHSRRIYPHLTFVQWDILEDSDVPDELSFLAQSSSSKGVLAIDLNGSRMLPALLQALDKVFHIYQWRPRLIIVKARSLHAKVKKCKENQQRC